MATWVIALLSNGPAWFTVEKIIVGIVMSLVILSASIWHYGARYDMYARKHWDPIYIKNPISLIYAGGLGFLTSIGIAITFLPFACTAIASLNAILIILYGKWIDRFWPWKNLAIAGICITPLLMGWFSGHRLHPIVLSLICATFLMYLAREILKDVVDKKANQGLRFTMVMSLGTSICLKIAGLLLLLATVPIIYAFIGAPTFIQIFNGMGVGFLVWFVYQLFQEKNYVKTFKLIDIEVGIILLNLLLLRTWMY